MDEPLDGQTGNLFDGVERAQRDKSEDSDTEITLEERPRGILSQVDREYLFGQKEYAQPQTDANRRQAIRERVRNGLEDFVYLSLMSDEEREKVFQELGEEDAEVALASMINFAYRGVDGDLPRFKQCIERGVLSAENREKFFQSAGRATDVDVSISIDRNPDVEKLREKLDEGDELTDAEIGVLVREGKVSPEDLDQLEDSERGFPGVYAGGPIKKDE